MLVMKFGGSSLRGAEEFRRVLNIVIDRVELNPVVVLSAGAGITDSLLEIADNSICRDIDSLKNSVDNLRERNFNIINELIDNPQQNQLAVEKLDTLCSELKELLTGISLLKECTERSRNTIVSYGELLSTTIFHHYCLSMGTSSNWVDIRNIISSDDINDTSSGLSHIKEKWYNLVDDISNYDIVITQGFIASDTDGHTTTLGRGGSDYSAAILGSALDADEIQIWTDVSGVLTADPRIIEEARTISSMSFAEIRELAYYGAKVLHPSTIRPAVERDIPVVVLNTFSPGSQGTKICTGPECRQHGPASVISKDCIAIRPDAIIHSLSHGLLAELISLFENNNIDILLTSSAENNFLIVLPDNENIIDLVYNQNVTMEKVSLICVVGVDMDISFPTTDMVRNILGTKGTLCLSGLSSESILAISPRNKARAILQEIHDIIISKKILPT